MKYVLFVSLIVLSALGCQDKYGDTNGATQGSSHSYPPAAGFNIDSSDAEAILLADEVMNAMAGYADWKATRFITWNFFGRHSLLWDKWTGDVRIEIPESKTIILVNINDSTGRAIENGVEIIDPDTLRLKYINRGVSIWINDSYWLVMPFKLKDSGVTLKYKGEQKTQAGENADMVQLTFENVGETPNHKYNVYIDKNTKLVTQWDYFDDRSKTEPRFSTPWQDYKIYGKILLSGDRGKGQLTDIDVLDNVKKSKFTEF